jgi:hypothetical protein
MGQDRTFLEMCVTVVQGDEAARSSPETEPAGGTLLPAREHVDTPVSCADTEPEPESDTGERAGDGRDPEDPAPSYSPR